MGFAVETQRNRRAQKSKPGSKNRDRERISVACPLLQTPARTGGAAWTTYGKCRRTQRQGCCFCSDGEAGFRSHSPRRRTRHRLIPERRFNPNRLRNPSAGIPAQCRRRRPKRPRPRALAHRPDRVGLVAATVWPEQGLRQVRADQRICGASLCAGSDTSTLSAERGAIFLFNITQITR